MRESRVCRVTAARSTGVWRLRASAPAPVRRICARLGPQLGALTLLVSLASCAGATSPAPRAARESAVVADAGVPPPAWKRRCEEYAGAPVKVGYQDASGGAAVLYRTKGDVRALRARTAEIADFHNGSRPKTPALHDLSNVPHYAYVEEIPEGAKLVLIPKGLDPRLLEKLRRTVQQEVTNMRKRGCGGGQEAL
jgi:hypothetical protein